MYRVPMLRQKFEWSLKMKRIDFKVLTIAMAFAVVLSVSSCRTCARRITLFKSKCAACHGADGTGSAMGKKMGAHDFTTADVQKMSDAQLTRHHHERQEQDAEVRVSEAGGDQGVGGLHPYPEEISPVSRLGRLPAAADDSAAKLRVCVHSGA
jgi:hypothetical protein